MASFTMYLSFLAPRRGTRAWPLLPVLFTMLLLLALPANVASARDCRFVLGFATLNQLIPDIAGDCLDDERHIPGSDQTVQPTTRGLMVWRKSDGLTVFTDGHRTWINGPNGLAVRLNTERFSWEADPVQQAAPPPVPVPVPAPAPPAPQTPPRGSGTAGALLPGHRIVAYYGNPRSAAMGILGELPPEQMLDSLEAQAQAYAALDPTTPVQPALELVAVVAQAHPGADGLYRGRMSDAEIDQVAQWAQSRSYPLILDVQPGLSSFQAEVEALWPFLARPYVHLALDPEWAMAPGQVPGQTFGSVDASTVNAVIQTLADIVAEHNLPPKVLIVHRFTVDMLTNDWQIQPHPNVQVVIVMDGVGGQGAKVSKYDALIRGQPVGFPGIKLFYTEDVNLLSPEQILN
ncbi:MAG TPA: hypothetical protein VGW38_26655, partial [Chloroflexota bacterium]|nr:hypothetical protein [Chloroflexota bacterium]